MIIRGPSEDDHLTQKKNERSVDSLNNYASLVDETKR